MNSNEKTPITSRELVEARKRREIIIEEASQKTKTAKKARKLREKINIHKSKATSTEIRKNAINQLDIITEKQSNGCDTNSDNETDELNSFKPTLMLEKSPTEKVDTYQPKLLPISSWKNRNFAISEIDELDQEISENNTDESGNKDEDFDNRDVLVSKINQKQNKNINVGDE